MPEERDGLGASQDSLRSPIVPQHYDVILLAGQLIRGRRSLW